MIVRHSHRITSHLASLNSDSRIGILTDRMVHRSLPGQMQSVQNLQQELAERVLEATKAAEKAREEAQKRAAEARARTRTEPYSRVDPRGMV